MTNPTVERMLPLFESKMLHHFDHRWATYDKGSTRGPTSEERVDPRFAVQPRYWVPATDIEDRVPQNWDHSWLIGFRKICRATDERTLIDFVFPMGGLGDSGNLMFPSYGPELVLPAVLSSFVCDYTLRQKLGGTNLNFFQFEQLPIPAPSEFTQATAWTGAASLSQWILMRAVELLHVSNELSTSANGMTDSRSPFQWSQARRKSLRNELDAAFFHVYGVNHADADYILDTFPIVRRKDEAEFGEYRTKRMILEIYDAMQEAVNTGMPYQTILDPPPGEGPRHPERGDA